MKTAKKFISVFMVCVLMITVFSLGFTGIAASVNLEQQYIYLSEYMKSEHVRNLANYKVTNTMDDSVNTQGFNTAAKAFSYEHIVYASDNEASEITKAANRFFYIAESLISTVNGVGYYTAHLLYNKIVDGIREYFDGKLYVDEYGNLYTPNDYELAEYEEAVAVLVAADYDITLENIRALAIYDIDFVEISEFDYFNVDTIISYFMGTGTYINAGNWYHTYLFAVETSVEQILLDSPDIWSVSSDSLDVYVGLYMWKYQRTYDTTRTKATYSFSECDESKVITAFGAEYGISAGQLYNAQLFNYRGQAENFILNKHIDDDTVPNLRAVYTLAEQFITSSGLAKGEKWDSVRGLTAGENFAQASSAELYSWGVGTQLKSAVKELVSTYSNDVLNHIYGDRMGNIMRLAYIATANGDVEPAVRETVGVVADYSAEPYEVNTLKLNEFVTNFDTLVNSEDATLEERDTADKVADILKQFFDTNADLFVGTAAYGIEFDTLTELVEQILVAFLFNDAMMTTIISKVYPMLCTTVIGLFDGVTGWNGLNKTIADIVNGLIQDNNMALFPAALADRIDTNDPYERYNSAISALDAADPDTGADIFNRVATWENVIWDDVTWGIDETVGFDAKADRFVDAISVVLSGLYTLLKLILCGDSEYCEAKAFDLSIIAGLGHMYAQGGYTKLFVPLYRVFGLNELSAYSAGSCNGYVSSQVYHNYVNSNETYAARMLLEPLIFWVTDCLAKNPIKEICKLVPNLVNFLTRTSNVPITEDGAASGGDIEYSGYSTVQTHNLYTILEHVHINVQVRIIGISAYTLHYTVISILETAMDKYDWNMLKSLNTLLDGLLGFEYETDVFESANVCAYSNADNSQIVLPDSAKYQVNPELYPNGHYLVYTNGNINSFSLSQDDEHPYEYTDYNYVSIPYKLPEIEETKLCDLGYVREDYNTLVLEESPRFPEASDTYGLTLLFLLRYLFSALCYKYNDSVDGLPYLVECFGIDLDTVLLGEMKLGDIIYNAVLRPDDAICAIMELFYPHDTGSLNPASLTDSSLYPIDNIEYYNDVLLDPSINPTLSYGPDVIYSTYWTRDYAEAVMNDIGPLVDNVLELLAVSGFEDGLSGFLTKLVNDNLFTDSIMNMLFNMFYKLLGGLNETTGFDIELVLGAVLDVTYSPAVIANRLNKILGFDVQGTAEMRDKTKWQDVFPSVEIPGETEGETVTVADSDVDWDWGLDDDTKYAAVIAEKGYSQGEVFIRILSALLSPLDFAIDYLLLDRDIEILNLITLPSYAGYQYSIIGLLELLTCPDSKILNYTQYYNATVGSDTDNTSDPNYYLASCNRIYYILSPILGLIENACASPIDTIFELIPNLMFFMSIGALNDLLNNLVHFVYVLLDMLCPLVNGYDLLNEILANLEVGGVALNLNLPLDVDLNQLVSSALPGILGESLTILEDEETGAKLNLVLPYIDFYTLCVGDLIKYSSKEQRITLHLGGDDGAGLLTSVLRLVIEVVFLDENKESIVAYFNEITTGLDDYDRETLMLLLGELYNVMQENQIPDLVLFALYYLITTVAPLSGQLADIFTKTDFTFAEFLGALGNIGEAGGIDTFISYVKEVAAVAGISTGSPTGSTTTIEATMGLFQKIQLFFQRIITLLKSWFNF